MVTQKSLLPLFGVVIAVLLPAGAGAKDKGHGHGKHQPKKHAVITYQEVTYTCWDYHTRPEIVPGAACGCCPPTADKICVADVKKTVQRTTLVPVVKWVVEHECEACCECPASCHAAHRHP